MIRRLTCATAATFVALAGVALLTAATDVTFVMKNGERLSGRFAYNHTDHYQLVVNGQERSFPSDDIAMISFIPGDPVATEVRRLPNVDNPPELERHTMVLRNGEMIRGKIYDFVGDSVIMDVRAGDRRTYNMSDIARLYISAPGARGVFKSVVMENPTPTPAPPPAGSIAVHVEGARQWTDSKIDVARGDALTFTATGQARVNNEVSVGPAGDRGLGTRDKAPVKNGPIGALIGRVGTGPAFVIGANTNPMTMGAAGRLMLGVNDDIFLDNGGSFDVTIVKTSGALRAR